MTASLIGERRELASDPVSLTVDALICTHTFERWSELCRALESVQRQSLPPERVVLVVDHNEALFERAKRTFRGVAIIRNDRPPGNAGARNAGIARCVADIVACLDDDAVAEPRWLERLMCEYVDERVLGVGGMIGPEWSTKRPPWFPDEFGWVVGCCYRGLPEVTTSVRNLIGANMSIRRQVLLELGGFAEQLGREGLGVTGHEETELCIRGLARFPGARWVYAPEAAVSHSVPAARARWSYFISRCRGEGLSKALMTRMTGLREGLTPERDYLLGAVPTGVLRGARDALRGDPSGLLRSAAIFCGVAATVWGYGRGLLKSRPRSKVGVCA